MMKPPHQRDDCHTRRHAEREQLNRLTVKALDQVFVMRAGKRLVCSQFRGQALTNLAKKT